MPKYIDEDDDRVMLYRPDQVHGAVQSEQKEVKSQKHYYYGIFSEEAAKDALKDGWHKDLAFLNKK